MKRRARLIAAGLALAAVSVSPHAAAPDPDRFTLGVLRRDGIITPFATFDGRRWRQDWPEPSRDRDIPITLRDVPSRWWGPLGPRETWQVWTGTTTKPLDLRVSRPEVYDAQCVPQIGLRSDYRSSEPRPGPDAQPYPKDGLAVSPPRVIGRIDIMPTAPIPAALVKAFNGSEAVTVSNGSGLLHSFNRQQREASPPTMEAMYAGGELSSRFYYVEMVRQYNSSNPKKLGECEALSFGSGWFVRDDDGSFRPIRFRVDVTTCDRDGLLYMLPLGLVRSGKRMFWVAQWSGWNFEQYDVVDLNSVLPVNVVRAPGGGC